MHDERPPIWIGHAALTVSDLERSTSFWLGLGLRPVGGNERVTVMELRGGTHLVLVPGAPAVGGAPFDLMVEDLDATHTDWSAAGLDVTEIERGEIHDSFVVRDPDGYEVTVNSSHVIGPV
jgi:catechol 2,3-dioxygenase-like lactoylglutathione lyase family enzyme